MRVNGIDLTPFSPQQQVFISTLALRHPGLVSSRELIEAIFPDPDEEPDGAARIVNVQAHRIRARWNNRDWRLASRLGRSGGYYLERIHAGD
jgi:hypothetical protein